MPPNSNNSSLEPQHGSAYSRSHADSPSQEPHAGTTYSAVDTTQSRCPADAQYYTDAMAQQPATTDDYQHQNGYATDPSEGCSYTSGNHSYSASTYYTWSASERQYQPQWDGQGYQQYGRHYLPTASNPPHDIPDYDSELVIDSVERDEARAWGDASRPPTQPRAGDGRAQRQQRPAPARNQQSQQNIAHTHTTQRWSREYSPEERMRVGLPRWETEQHRIDYQRRQS